MKAKTFQEAARAEREKWRKIGNLLERWAGDDGNADELTDLRSKIGLHSQVDDCDAPGFDEQEDKFWREFRRRMVLAFGKPIKGDDDE